MTYRLLSTRYLERFNVRIVNVTSLRLIESGADLRRVVLDVASDHNMDTNVWVKVFSTDMNGKPFFINTVNNKPTRIKDLLDEDLMSNIDDVVMMILNSNEAFEFGIGASIELQFLNCAEDGGFKIDPSWREIYFKIFPEERNKNL